MEIVSDIFLAAGALGAAFYCIVLGRRLNRFNDLEQGVGGAVAVLSAQVDDLTTTLTAAQEAANTSAEKLAELINRAEHTNRKLELQIAALHDMPEVVKKDNDPNPVLTEFLPHLPKDQPMFTRRNIESTAT